MAAVRQLGPLEVRNFNCPYGSEGPIYISVPIFVPIGQTVTSGDMADFRVFKTAEVRHIEFVNFEIVPAHAVRRPSMHHRVKLHANQLS